MTHHIKNNPTVARLHEEMLQLSHDIDYAYGHGDESAAAAMVCRYAELEDRTRELVEALEEAAEEMTPEQEWADNFAFEQAHGAR